MPLISPLLESKLSPLGSAGVLASAYVIVPVSPGSVIAGMLTVWSAPSRCTA